MFTWPNIGVCAIFASVLTSSRVLGPLDLLTPTTHLQEPKENTQYRFIIDVLSSQYTWRAEFVLQAWKILLREKQQHIEYMTPEVIRK